MKSKQNPIKAIFSYISEMGSLMFTPRTHQRSLINTFDNIASHSYHVGIIAYCLCRMERLSHEESLKAFAMAILHDSAESRTTDLDYRAKYYNTRDEEKAIHDQLQNLPFGQDLKSLIEEYEERDSLLSKCVKDADGLEQHYLEWILMHMGNKMAERWFKGAFSYHIPHLRTKSAKKLAQQMKKSRPNDWWFEEMVDNNFKAEFLNGKK